MFRLRVKTRDGKQYPLTDCLCGDSTLKDLLLAVQVITLILPKRQKILTGKLYLKTFSIIFLASTYLYPTFQYY